VVLTLSTPIRLPYPHILLPLIPSLSKAFFHFDTWFLLLSSSYLTSSLHIVSTMSTSSNFVSHPLTILTLSLFQLIQTTSFKPRFTSHLSTSICPYSKDKKIKPPSMLEPSYDCNELHLKTPSPCPLKLQWRKTSLEPFI